MKFLLLLLSFLLLIPNFFNTHLIKVDQKPTRNERFDSALANRIQSVNDLEKYTDSIAKVNHIAYTSINYANLLLTVVEDRFYHCYSHYSLSENWIAALSGRYLWFDLSAIVIPDDILKYPMAGCSQQCIVMMAVLKDKHIDFKKVGWTHHYTIEARFNNRWVYLDPDLEPEIDFKNPGLDYLIKNNNIQERYKNHLPQKTIDADMKSPYTQEIKGSPAPKAELFHRVTMIISHWLWMVPLFLFVWSFKRKTVYAENNAAAISNTIIDNALYSINEEHGTPV